MSEEISEARAEEIARLVRSWADKAFDEAGYSSADWSDPTQPVTYGDAVEEQAYRTCKTLSVLERSVLVAFAWGENPIEHINVLARVAGGSDASELEQAVAALILMWYVRV